MNEKMKNPLYVVKEDQEGKIIEEAKGWLDLVIKKFNLTSFIEALGQIIKILIESIDNYPMFISVKKSIDGWLDKIQEFLQQRETTSNQ